MKKSIIAVTVISETDNIEIISPSLLSDSFGITEIRNEIQGEIYTLQYDLMHDVEIESDIKAIDLVWYCSKIDKLYSAKVCINESFKEDEYIIIIKIFESGRLKIYLGNEYRCRLLYNADFSFSLSGNEYKNSVFKYRYSVFSDMVDIKSLEQVFSDGSYDFSDFKKQTQYEWHGIPEFIKLRWNHEYSEWTSYFKFENQKIKVIFDKVYGIHRDSKTDFIIRIDAENKKYELSLYRQGLKKPVIIPEDAYQLIVFKNKFEDYRSENYNQPRGAWIW